MTGNFYETDQAVSEYLLFHYALTKDLLPAAFLGDALDFPVRCVGDCLDMGKLPANARGLDLGCAVGRASFELARHCQKVVGIDYSERFISIADKLRKQGSHRFAAVTEGVVTQTFEALVPRDIQRNRVTFEVGDATGLRSDLGQFDVVLMANLIDRLVDPRKCLDGLPGLMQAGGQLILTSPYTWTTTYTPGKLWLGGFLRDGKPVRTLQTLQEILAPNFEFLRVRDLPFLIREHARKFQLGISEASIWIRR